MKTRHSPSPELLSLAAVQGGVVSREQVFGLGLTRRPLDRLFGEGRWLRLYFGLYVVHDQPPAWVGLAWGGVLIGGPESRLGGTAAGFLHELSAEPDQIQVMIPYGRAFPTAGC